MGTQGVDEVLSGCVLSTWTSTSDHENWPSLPLSKDKGSREINQDVRKLATVASLSWMTVTEIAHPGDTRLQVVSPSFSSCT